MSPCHRAPVSPRGSAALITSLGGRFFHSGVVATECADVVSLAEVHFRIDEAVGGTIGSAFVGGVITRRHAGRSRRLDGQHHETGRHDVPESGQAAVTSGGELACGQSAIDLGVIDRRQARGIEAGGVQDEDADGPVRAAASRRLRGEADAGPVLLQHGKRAGERRRPENGDIRSGRDRGTTLGGEVHVTGEAEVTQFQVTRGRRGQADADAGDGEVTGITQGRRSGGVDINREITRRGEVDVATRRRDLAAEAIGRISQDDVADCRNQGTRSGHNQRASLGDISAGHDAEVTIHGRSRERRGAAGIGAEVTIHSATKGDITDRSSQAGRPAEAVTWIGQGDVPRRRGNRGGGTGDDGTRLGDITN